ncbi:MAG: hypothetical protein ACHREM_13435, partial [Polyangiales bacterium]
GVRVDPTRVTMSVRVGPAIRVGIFGWRPGARLVVGARARLVHVVAHPAWGTPKRIFVRGRWVDWGEHVRWREKHEGGRGHDHVGVGHPEGIGVRIHDPRPQPGPMPAPAAPHPHGGEHKKH